jgi:hypothetical protein
MVSTNSLNGNNKNIVFTPLVIALAAPAAPFPFACLTIASPPR